MLQKIYLILMMSVTFALQGKAQIAEGAIRYEFTMDMHRNIPPEREDMKGMIPQYRKHEFVLVFNLEERLYKGVEEEAPVSHQGRGGGPRITMRAPRNETYINNATQERTVFVEMMGRNYLIVDTLALAPWRLGNEFMDIEGYRCQMAFYTDTIANEEVTAWFTVGIQPFLGPDKYSSLPGAILALDINNGERVWVARKVEVRPITRNEIRKPSRGDVITRPEFDKIMEEQRERMRQGGGGFRF